MGTPLEDLMWVKGSTLRMRGFKALEKAGFTTVEELIALRNKGVRNIERLPGVGASSYRQILDSLKAWESFKNGK